MRVVSLLAVAAGIRSVAGWGAVGHEIVATIAQIHLHPSVVEHLCDVLPHYANCHLAPVAAWADNVRRFMHWSSTLHYVNGVDDHPSQHCVFGEKGWQGAPRANVLSAIQNTTEWINAGNPGEEEALKFLIHFLGDLHQPLHLTGREKGGNGVKVRFDGRVTNLHSVWDSRLIAKSLRTIPQNYTLPLPSKRVESALRGTIYDPYIRQIMHEGIFGRFADQINDWISCPADIRQPSTPSLDLYQSEYSEQQSLVLSNIEGADAEITPPSNIPPTDNSLICPYAWAEPMHQLNCDIIWPPALDELYVSTTRDLDDNDLESTFTYLELDTPEYAGAIKKAFLVEELLAKGGIRLAAILNYLYATEDAVLLHLD